jgi:hypothetical protein
MDHLGSSNPPFFVKPLLKYSEERRRTVDRRIRMEEIAVSVGLTSKRIPSHIIFGSVTAFTPEIKMAMMSSSKELMKANRPAEISPGRIRGKVMWKKVRRRFAPRFMEALSRLSSKLMSVEETMITL